MESRRDKEKFLEERKALYDIPDKREGTERKNEIIHGFAHGLTEEDVSVYAAPGFSGHQMQAIRVAMEEGIPRDRVQKEIALPSLSAAQMLAAKARHYREGAQAGGAVPGIYIKSIEMAFEQLKAQTRLSEAFYRDAIESLRGEKNELREELGKLRLRGARPGEAAGRGRAPQEGEAHPKGGPSKSGALGNPQGRRFSLFPSQRLGGKGPAWLIELMCEEAFDAEQCKELRRAYKAGLGKKDILKFAKAKVPAGKMRGVIGMLMEIHQLEDPESNAAEPPAEHGRATDQAGGPRGFEGGFDGSASMFEEEGEWDDGAV